MGFPKQEYQSGLPFPSPGDLPDMGLEHVSSALPGRFFTAEPPGKLRAGERSNVFPGNAKIPLEISGH